MTFPFNVTELLHKLGTLLRGDGEGDLVSPLPKTTPTPTPKYPGEEQFMTDLSKKTGKNPEEYRKMYHEAIESPGWTGKYYGNQTPPPKQLPVKQTTPTPATAKSQAREMVGEDPAVIKKRLEDVYKKYMPRSSNQSVEEYYPAAKYFDKLLEKEKLRKGAGVLGALQAFYESTGGRASNRNNLFGTMPQGEGGKPSVFNDFGQSIDYQYGPHVLGGGANPNMNILREPTNPLTPEDIRALYKSYNPSGDYVDSLLNDYGYVMGGGGQ